MKTLVTGGVRSGKSFQAESLLVGEPAVTYVAPGPPADPAADPEWAARVAAHQAQRPAHWTTVETADLADAITATNGAVLIDCMGTWLNTTISELDGWAATLDDWQPEALRRLDATCAAISAHPEPVVIVTHEVGLGVAPEQRRARIFRDLLGTVNHQIADECDDVLLVVAGRVLRL